MSQIFVKNISSAMVGIAAPGIRFNRELRPGRAIPISKEEYTELMYEPGVHNLLIGGFIRFDGVEEKDEVIQTEETLDREQIAAILKDRDITTFAKFIPTAPAAAKDTVVSLAVELGITDRPFVVLISKYCGVDIIQAISMKHQAEE